MDTPKPPSLREIAAAAGVSKTTVSLALRNHPSIGAKTRLRVHEVAQAMGYRVNPFVAALLAAVSRSQSPPTQAPLAYVSDETREDLRRQPRRRLYWDHAEQRAAELGYRLDRFWLGSDGLSGARLNGILRARGIGGVVFGLVQAPESVHGLDFGAFACASIDRQPTLPEVSCAESDAFGSTMQLFERLAARGYRRIGLSMDVGSDRRHGYRGLGALHAFHTARGWGPPVPPLEPELWEPPVFQQWLERHEPDVVVTSNSEVLDWLRAAGRDVPAAIGYANLAVAPGNAVESGLRVDAVGVAAGAVDLVDAQLRRNERGLPVRPKRLMVWATWEEGQTLRPAPPAESAAAPTRDPGGGGAGTVTG